ncbi:MAG: hypothetical protein U5K72_20505 [Balneolaceae bacterium]|nr:hypothetical protein [Balneolaceae bacterium]
MNHSGLFLLPQEMKLILEIATPKKKLFHVDDIPIKNDQPYYVEKE